MIKNRTIYIILFLGLFIFHIFYEDYLSFYLFIIFLILPLVSCLLSFLPILKLRAKLNTKSTFIAKNTPYTFKLSFNNNHTILPLPVKVTLLLKNKFFELKDKKNVSFNLHKNQKNVEIKLETTRCGEITVHVDKIAVYDMLGIFCFKVKHPKIFLFNYVVLPNEEVLQLDIELQQKVFSSSGSVLGNHFTDDVLEVDNYTPYKPGDKLSQINWKLFYKSNELMVKQSDSYLAPHMLLINTNIDNNNDEHLDTLDSIMDVAFSLSIFLKASNQNFILKSTNHKELYLKNTVFEVEDDIFVVFKDMLSKPYNNNIPLKDILYLISSALYFSTLFYFCTYITSTQLIDLSTFFSGHQICIIYGGKNMQVIKEISQQVASLNIEIYIV